MTTDLGKIFDKPLKIEYTCMSVEVKLIKYRDAGMHSYTYFWTMSGKTVSPYFDSDIEAIDWLTAKLA